MVLFAARTIRVAARTTTGDQDITISGIGTPKAVRIDFTVARVNGTVANSALWSVGVTDFTRTRCMGVTSVTASNPTLAVKAGSTDQIAFLINGTGTAAALSATVVSAITDGIRVNFNTVDGLGHFMHVTFYYGSSLSAYVGSYQMADHTGSPNSTENVTAPNFQPDWVQGWMGPATYASGVTPSNQVQVSEGHAVRSPSLKNFVMARTFQTAIATSRAVMATDETRIAHIVGSTASTLPLSVTHSLELSAFLSTGFTLKDKVGTLPPEFMYLAIRWGGRDVNLDKITTPTSTNGTVVVDHTRRINSALILGTIADAVGDKADTQAGMHGLGFIDRFDSNAWGQYDKDNVSPSSSGTVSRSTTASTVLTDAGADGLTATGAFGTKDITLTYTTVQGTGRVGWIVTCEEEIAGTAAFTLPSLTMAAAGKQVMKGTSAMTLPHLTMAASGSQNGVVVGSGAMTLPHVTMAAAGREVMRGTSALTLPSLQIAAAGREVMRGTSAMTLPHVTMAAAGREVFRGPSALVLPSLQLVAEGGSIQFVFGNGAMTLPSLSMVAAGREVMRGTSAMTLPSLQIAAQGKEVQRGTGAIVLPSLSLTAAGREVFRGTSALTLPHITMASAGVVTNTGVAGNGNLTLPSLSTSGVGREVFRGTSGVVLPSLQIQGQGREVVRGAGAVTLPSLALAATGREVFRGTGAVTLPSISLISAGTVTAASITGAGAMTLPHLSMAGVGREVVRGTGTIVLPSLRAAGSNGALLASYSFFDGSYDVLSEFAGST